MVQLTKPSPGNVTQGYSAKHRAIDYAHGAGRAIYAAASGTVTLAHDSYYGYSARITHADGSATRYCHMANYTVQDGSYIGQGMTIGAMGATGSFAQGVHLHFEYYVDGRRVDPAPYFTSTAGGGGTPIGDDELMSVIYVKENGTSSIWCIDRATRTRHGVSAAEWELTSFDQSFNPITPIGVDAAKLAPFTIVTVPPAASSGSDDAVLQAIAGVPAAVVNEEARRLSSAM